VGGEKRSLQPLHGVIRHWLGSFVLFLAVAAVVVRPWEGKLEEGPASAVAPVTRVVDGDTIEVRLGGRSEDVRLIGVDTPETVKPDTPVQCFGERASHFTKRRLTGRRVRLVFGVERRDVYGRLLAYVYLHGRFFNPILVRRGLARSLTIPPNDRFAPRFRRLELAAARTGRGLWGAC
jgi:micrococcal nuclease